MYLFIILFTFVIFRYHCNPLFTFVYLYIPLCMLIYLYVPFCTFVYLCLPVCTFFVPLFTFVYRGVPFCTFIYLCVPLCTFVYFCIHLCTFAYLFEHWYLWYTYDLPWSPIWYLKVPFTASTLSINYHIDKWYICVCTFLFKGYHLSSSKLQNRPHASSTLKLCYDFHFCTLQFMEIL